jgi:acyl-[acyl-carrier-protein]-phospholipid O-acyltransferase/long-chain-fatty-acid--[acyl-carrier-protein] ligase
MLASRRFLPLFVTQALGALNDNMFKTALAVLVIFQAGPRGPMLTAATGGVFILPFALFSAIAGQLADRFDKARLIRFTKIWEIGLMALAAFGFALHSVPVLMAVLFGLGMQAAFFSPLKYGILPDHLSDQELVRGNGLVEAGTFVGILAGTIAGSELIGLGGNIVGWLGVALAVTGFIASAFVPKAPPAPGQGRGAGSAWNILGQTIVLIKSARANRPVWLSILGLSWFWTLGAIFITEFPVLAAKDFGAGNGVVTLMLAFFAIGVGAGSLLAARLLSGDVSPRLVPFAISGLSIFGFLFCACIWHVTPQTGWHDVMALATHPKFALAMLCLFGVAVSGGVFSVPLYALMQERADPAFRARMVAANNVVNAAWMVVGAAIVAGLARLQIGAAGILLIATLTNLFFVACACKILPREVLRGTLRVYFRLFHSVTITGLEHYRAAGPRVLILPNHQSYLDGALIAAFLPDDPSFVVDTGVAKKWWAWPFLASVDVLTTDPTNPFAVREMVRAVQGGRKLMIFPEGRITKTGGLMKIYDGAGMIADRADAQMVIVRIDGALFSPVSQMGGKLRRKLFPKLSLTFMPPVKLTVEPGLQGRARRRALATELQDLFVLAEQSTRRIDKTLFAALLDSAALYGKSSPIIEDIAFAPLSYKKLILGALVLGRQLSSLAGPGQNLGVMLPSANGAMVTFFALQAFGRVPAMLNFSAGAAAMLSACKAARVDTVLCSRAFVEKAKLEKTIAAMETELRFVWLDDVRAGLTTKHKLRGLLDSLRARKMPGARANPNSPAVVLFTSGSEGTPKGVALSHRNILANCAQIGAVVDFSPADRVLNALPIFHSFGLTGAALLPLFAGVRTFHYPSPLHYRVVPELFYGTDATIAFGTDTFLSGWARYAHPYDFRSMRYIFAGGEALREETRRLYADRFGVRVLQGYGVTETSPVLALNTPMQCRPGSVGRLLPGIEWRLAPVEGVDQGGRLAVRGPNVMLGYLRAEAPGVIEPPEEGWYDTGDIVTCDASRFVTIQGRAKRFAKIGGEMVSMAAAESLAAKLWPNAQHAVLAVPDARKGEALLLVTTQQDADTKTLLAYARANTIAELMVPRSLQVVAKMPLLGTGKIDLPALERSLKPAPLANAPENPQLDEACNTAPRHATQSLAPLSTTS